MESGKFTQPFMGSNRALQIFLKHFPVLSRFVTTTRLILCETCTTLRKKLEAEDTSCQPLVVGKGSGNDINAHNCGSS